MSDEHALALVWHTFLDKYDIEVLAAEPDDGLPACPTCHEAHATKFAAVTCAYQRASADLSLWATELDDATTHLSAMNANYMDAIDREDRARRKHRKAVLWLHTCLMRVRETAGTIDEVAA